jgi:diguanylate cyclase (GGDEF)-like protein
MRKMSAYETLRGISMISLLSEPELLRELAARMKTGHVGLIYLDILEYAGTEASRGRAFCSMINLAASRLLMEYRKQTAGVIAVRNTGDDWFLFVQLEEQDPGFACRRLEERAVQVKELLAAGIPDAIGEPLNSAIYMGHSLLVETVGKTFEHMLYSTLKHSIRSIHLPATLVENESKWEEFRTIIEERRTTTVYQPIVSLCDSAIFGYEALTRGPVNSVFHAPLELFQFAEQHGALYTLDRLAREKAIEGCRGLRTEQRVFINIPAHVIHDSQFASGKTIRILEKYGINPHNVVLEITERTSIEDFATAKRILQHYRNQGFQIAIDDAGAGYSSLQAIAELQPDFIKVDRSLIQDIHLDKMKETILETFVSFARKLSIRIIAEGIESWDELKKLSQMGVHYGQGYLLGRPGHGLAELKEGIASEIERINRIQGMGGIMQIGNLASHIRCFSHQMPISEVANFFKQNEEAAGTVILNGQQPVGLVMREKLFQQLAGQYGISLYWNRPIAQLMDRAPLIVDETSPIEKVSQMAMSREKNRLYDLVVITVKEKMMGVASIQTILEAITNLRMETARVANPLTGLPGNTPINREMNKRLFDDMPFSVIYADLDFFKWFNDRYGFQKGDQLIQFTADVLQQSVSVCGHPHDFVGHIGGDDFIVITSAEDSAQLCKEIIRRFQQGVGMFYEAADWSFVEDRSGNKVQSDGVHISLSLVICKCGLDITLDRISQTAAVLKKMAKAQTGSVYLEAYLDGCCVPGEASKSGISCSIL